MSKNMKPLAKSLHTVTVLVRLAQHLESTARTATVPPATWFDRVNHACSILGIDGKPDAYGLREAAIKQLEKGDAQ